MWSTVSVSPLQVFDPLTRLWGWLHTPMRPSHQNRADTLVWDDFYPRHNAGEAQSSGLTMVHCQPLGMSTMGRSLHGFLLLCVGPWLCLRSVAPKGSGDGSSQYLFLGSPPSVPGEVIYLLHKFCTMFQAVTKEWLHLIPLKAIRHLLQNAKETFWLINVWGCTFISQAYTTLNKGWIFHAWIDPFFFEHWVLASFLHWWQGYG